MFDAFIESHGFIQAHPELRELAERIGVTTWATSIRPSVGGRLDRTRREPLFLMVRPFIPVSLVCWFVFRWGDILVCH